MIENHRQSYLLHFFGKEDLLLKSVWEVLKWPLETRWVSILKSSYHHLSSSIPLPLSSNSHSRPSLWEGRVSWVLYQFMYFLKSTARNWEMVLDIMWSKCAWVHSAQLSNLWWMLVCEGFNKATRAHQYDSKEIPHNHNLRKVSTSSRLVFAVD